MIKHILQTLFALAVVVFCVQYLLASPESDYPFDKNVSDHNREIISNAMEIVEKECPYLAALDWAASPAKLGLFNEISMSRKGDWLHDPDGDLAERGWDEDVGVFVNTDVDVPPFIISIGAGHRPGIRAIYHPNAEKQNRGAVECNLELIDDKYYFRDVPALSILEELE